MNGGGDGVDSSNARVSIVDGIDWYYRQSRVREVTWCVPENVD